MPLRTNLKELRSKEVICVDSGQRLGYIQDVEVDMAAGKLLSLLVPGQSRGLFGRAEDMVVPWEAICRIGDDIILVDLQPGGRNGKNKGVWPEND